MSPLRRELATRRRGRPLALESARRRPCVWCRRTFSPVRRDALFCGRTCTELDRQYRRAIEAELGHALEALTRIQRMMAKRQVSPRASANALNPLR